MNVCWVCLPPSALPVPGDPGDSQRLDRLGWSQIHTDGSKFPGRSCFASRLNPGYTIASTGGHH